MRPTPKDERAGEVVGSYVKSPLPAKVSVAPLANAMGSLGTSVDPLILEVVSGSLSGSESAPEPVSSVIAFTLLRKLLLVTSYSFAVAVGGLFDPLTVTVTVAVSVSPPKSVSV